MNNNLRNKTHISALGRLDVCLSFDDLMCISIKWANNILAGDKYATLPSNAKPDIFQQATLQQ